ncbi:hypothetical protein J0B03_02440 [Alkalibacter rhizosphaerae]|uniref:Uncharacterized protein n=1 Tax=Alkalibacter rhizosphaerae TaxID=2815577 RepID=A0A974XIG2_9FIRM|nr:hypothetical protein [Alkalibacter rhizosphaerae]QSX08958.1 hypothetical protein J0B03_02440 [Alkalibacter rhizosphaerae]
MSKVYVNPGVCGLETTILVEKSGRSDLKITLDTKCPYIKNMEPDLQELDAYTECFSKFGDSAVYESANRNCKHLACPVPSAIIKAIEVESGLALPREVQFIIEK